MCYKIIIVSNTQEEIGWAKDLIPKNKDLFQIMDEEISPVAALKKAEALEPDVIILNRWLFHMPSEEFIQQLYKKAVYSEIVLIDFKVNIQYKKCGLGEAVMAFGKESKKDMERALKRAVRNIKQDQKSLQQLQNTESDATEKEELLRILSNKAGKSKLSVINQATKLDLTGDKLHAISMKLASHAVEKKNISETLSVQVFSEIKQEIKSFLYANHYGEVFQSDAHSVHMILNDFHRGDTQGEKERFVAINSIAKSVGRKRIPLLEGNDINYYISGSIDGVQNICIGFDQIEELQTYSFFTRHMNVLEWNYVARCINRTSRLIIDEYISKIEGGVVARDSQEIEKRMDELFFRIIKSSMDFDSYHYACGRLNDMFNEALRSNDIVSDQLFLFFDSTDVTVEQAVTRIKENFRELLKQISVCQKYESPIISTVVDYINENYGKPITLTYIAEKMCMSRSYLCFLFKQETGENLHDYIRKVRIQKAKKILSQSSSKIYKVAEAVGFDNPRYFSTVFKGMTGSTPSDFQRTIRLKEHAVTE